MQIYLQSFIYQNYYSITLFSLYQKPSLSTLVNKSIMKSYIIALKRKSVQKESVSYIV